MKRTDGDGSGGGPDRDALYKEQYRMRRLQVYNWGTFSDMHDIPIAERGFLFVGRSGSGKSTLLDAIATLLVPPRHVSFNAAAREVDRSAKDRNLITYIRGAWSEQKDQDSGNFAIQYLRPNTTWSAIALTYENQAGRTVTLLQVFSVRGNSNNNQDVKRSFFILEREFDLSELNGFDLDVRKLKQSLGENVFMRDEFQAYAEKFRRLLGIESDMALRLLHKAQSAKDLGDLNSFLRDFMLDRPETFKAADTLVTEFSELNSAHQSVVTARKQIQILQPARVHHSDWQDKTLRKADLETERGLIHVYRDKQMCVLLKDRISALHTECLSLTALVEQRQQFCDTAKEELADLERKHRELGGDQIAFWEQQLVEQEKLRELRLSKKSQADDAYRKLGWSIPTDVQAFTQSVGKAKSVVEDFQSSADNLQKEHTDLTIEKNGVAEQFEATQRELAALKKQSSNIPADMLEMRRKIASALSLPESSLPFAGELIEVRGQEREWQGAIERLMRNFALSILVEEKHYNHVNNHVNSTNLHGRIVYYRTDKIEKRGAHSAPIGSVASKLNVKSSVHKNWIENELTSRFDHECVKSAQALRNVPKGITVEGLIKQSNNRHEKDDRKRIDDQRYWVLGFDNKEKLAIFTRQAEELQEQIQSIEKKLAALSDLQRKRQVEAIHCQTLANLQWSEIDVAPVIDKINWLNAQISDAKKQNKDLEKLSEQIEKQRRKIKRADDELAEAMSSEKTANKELVKAKEQLETTAARLDASLLNTQQEANFKERYERAAEAVTIENVDKVTLAVSTGYHKDSTSLAEEVSELSVAIRNAFGEFKRHWPTESANMDETLESASDFFALLTRLETDNLPQFEDRFFELLQTQSTQNLAALSTHLSNARKNIHERMELVNESLSKAEFNTGTYLRIQSSDKQTQEVRDFKQELQNALSNAWNQERERAEERFEILRKLVNKLSSEEPEFKRWRLAVLDVRHHIEFVASEIDVSGNEIEVYRSGAGKSGGQKQKLATTCLAAALHYQLNRDDTGVPRYSSIVLDEAFDKADNEFTTLAMNIFAKFGFQMIVATPFKAVMTLEPFVAGACFVENNDRKTSKFLMIEYDHEQNKLIRAEEHGTDLVLST